MIEPKLIFKLKDYQERNAELKKEFRSAMTDATLTNTQIGIAMTRLGVEMKRATKSIMNLYSVLDRFKKQVQKR